MRTNTHYDVINEPVSSHRQTPQKVVAAIVLNGATALNMRQALNMGLTVREFKQALWLHAQVAR